MRAPVQPRYGSSPLLRGSRDADHRRVPHRRFIPAHAGDTRPGPCHRPPGDARRLPLHAGLGQYLLVSFAAPGVSHQSEDGAALPLRATVSSTAAPTRSATAGSRRCLQGSGSVGDRAVQFGWVGVSRRQPRRRPFPGGCSAAPERRCGRLRFAPEGRRGAGACRRSARWCRRSGGALPRTPVASAAPSC